jgi:transcription antitermination factor NusG
MLWNNDPHRAYFAVSYDNVKGGPYDLGDTVEVIKGKFSTYTGLVIEFDNEAKEYTIEVEPSPVSAVKKEVK